MHTFSKAWLQQQTTMCGCPRQLTVGVEMHAWCVIFTELKPCLSVFGVSLCSDLSIKFVPDGGQIPQAPNIADLETNSFDLPLAPFLRLFLRFFISLQLLLCIVPCKYYPFSADFTLDESAYSCTACDTRHASRCCFHTCVHRLI